MTDWIEHDGKRMPVDGDALVVVKHRDGDMSEATLAKYWHSDTNEKYSSWSHSVVTMSDIVAYKVIENA